MNTLPNPAKRIVSKSRYVVVQAERAFWWLDSLLFYLVAALCLVIVLGFACGLLRHAPLPLIREIVTTQHVWMLLSLPGLIYLCSTVGKWCLTRSRKIEPVVPLLARTEHSLPAPDILVRASQQPFQTQQSVLLRSAMQSEQTPPEQLVRSS